MIFVSTRFPEEIPWFKASRRGVVAAMSQEVEVSNVRYKSYLYDATGLSAFKDAPRRTEIA